MSWIKVERQQPGRVPWAAIPDDCEMIVARDTSGQLHVFTECNLLGGTSDEFSEVWPKLVDYRMLTPDEVRTILLVAQNEGLL